MSPSTEFSRSSCRESTACGCGNVKANAPSMPINLAQIGERGTIVRISGKEETKKFLAGLGFTAGACVTPVCKVKGSMVIEVKGSKIAVDRDMASKIMFCPES